jgi:hypothetical protein
VIASKLVGHSTNRERASVIQVLCFCHELFSKKKFRIGSGYRRKNGRRNLLSQEGFANPIGETLKFLLAIPQEAQ